MPTISFQVRWDQKEPKTQEECDEKRIDYLRERMDIDPELWYSLEDLEVMFDERDVKDEDQE